MRAKHCKGCQAEMDPDAIFCNECGLTFLDSPSLRSSFPDTIVSALPSKAVSRETPGVDFKTCPDCRSTVLRSARFCTKCSHDFSPPAVNTNQPPEMPSFLSPTANEQESSFSPDLVAAVKRRYREGYIYARFLDGFGLLVIIIGVLIGVSVVFTGISAGAALEQQASRATFGGGPSGAGVVFGFIISALGVVFGGLFVIFGTIMRAGAQHLKTSFDGVVHSSPFLTNIDRAEMMSLPGAVYLEKKTFEPVTAAIRPPISASPVQRVEPMAANVKAALAYGASFFVSLLWLPVPIYFLATTPVEQRLVRFHAFQSMLLTVASLVVAIVFAYLFDAASLAMPLVLISIFPSILCIVKAYNNEEFKFPIIGDFAMNLAASGQPINAVQISSRAKENCGVCGVELTQSEILDSNVHNTPPRCKNHW